MRALSEKKLIEGDSALEVAIDTLRSIEDKYTRLAGRTIFLLSILSGLLLLGIAFYGYQIITGLNAIKNLGQVAQSEKEQTFSTYKEAAYFEAEASKVQVQLDRQPGDKKLLAIKDKLIKAHQRFAQEWPNFIKTETLGIDKRNADAVDTFSKVYDTKLAYLPTGLFVSFIVIFSVLISLYRYYLNQISKAEHYRIGFMRIRVAALTSKEKFESEVRRSLTANAFELYSEKGKRIESPLPGHIGSDLVSALLNKTLSKK